MMQKDMSVMATMVRHAPEIRTNDRIHSMNTFICPKVCYPGESWDQYVPFDATTVQLTIQTVTEPSVSSHISEVLYLTLLGKVLLEQFIFWSQCLARYDV